MYYKRIMKYFMCKIYKVFMGFYLFLVFLAGSAFQEVVKPCKSFYYNLEQLDLLEF